MRFAELVLGRHGNVCTICITHAAIWQSNKILFSCEILHYQYVKKFHFFWSIFKFDTQKTQFRAKFGTAPKRAQFFWFSPIFKGRSGVSLDKGFFVSDL